MDQLLAGVTVDYNPSATEGVVAVLHSDLELSEWPSNVDYLSDLTTSPCSRGDDLTPRYGCPTRVCSGVRSSDLSFWNPPLSNHARHADYEKVGFNIAAPNFSLGFVLAADCWPAALVVITQTMLQTVALLTATRSALLGVRLL